MDKTNPANYAAKTFYQPLVEREGGQHLLDHYYLSPEGALNHHTYGEVIGYTSKTVYVRRDCLDSK